MLIRTEIPIPSSEITPKDVQQQFRANRRQFLVRSGKLSAGAAAAALFPAAAYALNKLQTVPGKFNVTDTVTPQAKAQSYNNYYEFGLDKGDPAHTAGSLHTRPWTIRVEGLVKKPQTIDIDALMRYRPIEQRIYRFRCVEAWSMVIPWDGYPLSELINFVNPLPSAKYVVFNSLADPAQMPNLNGTGFGGPYQEGLRMDEAMHPLTLLTFGSYGETLANQQGAPVRVIVPWKYGYKSPKAIVKIRFVDKQPSTTWNDLNPPAYGFYSNVNPNLDGEHSSRSHDRRLDSANSILPKIVATQPFNGYGDQVASLYSGMDLSKYY